MNQLRLNLNQHQVPTKSRSYLEDNFPQAFEVKSNLDQRSEPEYVFVDHYLTVSSNDRNSTQYPLHYNYKVGLVSTYKNVVSVGLISAVLPNTSGILDEPYLVLGIDELDFIDFGSLENNHKGFTTLPIKTPSKATGGFIVPDLASSCNSEVLFRTPIARLPSLSVKIRDYKGDLYDFGFAGGSTAKANQHSFTLKITTRELSRSQLANRNVS